MTVRRAITIITLCMAMEIQLTVCRVNLALGKPASQSGNYNEIYTAEKAVDGNKNRHAIHGKSCSITSHVQHFQWWMVDLQNGFLIDTIKITNRGDCCQDRLANFIVEVSMEDPRTLRGFPSTTNATICIRRKEAFSTPTVFRCNHPVAGRYVRIYRDEARQLLLTLCEVEIFGKQLPAPEPKPKPKPNPEPDPNPGSKPNPDPDPNPEWKPNPEPDSNPESKSNPEPDPNPEWKPNPEPDPNSESKSNPETDPKPESKPNPEPDTNSESKPKLEPNQEPISPSHVEAKCRVTVKAQDQKDQNMPNAPRTASIECEFNKIDFTAKNSIPDESLSDI